MSLEEARVKEEEISVKKEPDWDAQILMDCKKEFSLEDESVRACVELYVDHLVKNELVLGPELFQRADSAYAAANVLDPSLLKTCKQEPGFKSKCNQMQPQLRDCFVRLERLPTSKIKLARHKHAHANHDSNSRIKYNQNKPAVSKTYNCKTCGEEFSVKSLFIQHLRQHRPCKCQVCYITFSDQTPLRRHSLLHIVEKGSKSCSNCNEEFASRSALIKHIRKHLEETTCQICNKKFSSTYTLDEHKLIHTGGIPYICDICGQCFTYKSSLVVHIQMHDGSREKKISCDVCNKQFPYEAPLLAHKRSHTGEKPFPCEICGRKFSATNNLKKHKLTHTANVEERRFSCDLCKKMFIRKDNLTKHKRIHTGEKPFACEICDSQ
ncbi:zinc finger protein 728-like [Cydia pomonella]|uniref:zinc finger protein 728-like n=1 Tax=Cydia pomonella TaxID=82600 RepID=UPI002ADE4447|nr:zinc finger protein 728-like [Cydia pomonella]